MKVFKLTKGATKPSSVETTRESDAHRKFLAGLEELRRVRTVQEFQTAKQAGVEFSIDGFRRRARIGNQAMRTTHSDLFDELKEVLKFIHEEVLGVQKSSRGRSKAVRTSVLVSPAEKKLAEVEALLDRRERDFLDLLKELRLLRSQRVGT